MAALLVWTALALPAPAVAAAARAWNADRVSPAINYGGVEVAVKYSSTLAADASGLHTISRVRAAFTYESGINVSVRLCWNGTSRCIPLTSASVHTNAFIGLDARKPMYLVYTAPGKGALPSPLYVRGNIIVWYGP